MGKMGELHAEGVTDLHSYNVGKQDGKMEHNLEVIATIRKVLENPDLDLRSMSAEMALTVLVGVLQIQQEEAEDE